MSELKAKNCGEFILEHGAGTLVYRKSEVDHYISELMEVLSRIKVNPRTKDIHYHRGAWHYHGDLAVSFFKRDMKKALLAAKDGSK